MFNIIILILTNIKSRQNKRAKSGGEIEYRPFNVSQKIYNAM